MGCASSTEAGPHNSSRNGVGHTHALTPAGTVELQERAGSLRIMRRQQHTNTGGIFRPDTREKTLRKGDTVAVGGKYKKVTGNDGSTSPRTNPKTSSNRKPSSRDLSNSDPVLGNAGSSADGDRRPASTSAVRAALPTTLSRSHLNPSETQAQRRRPASDRDGSLRKSRSRPDMQRVQSRSLLKRMGSAGSHSRSPLPSPVPPQDDGYGEETVRSRVSCASSVVPDLRLDLLPGPVGQEHRAAQQQQQSQCDARSQHSMGSHDEYGENREHETHSHGLQRNQSKGFALLKQFQKQKSEGLRK